MPVTRNEKIRLNAIQTVTLRKNSLTKSRRGEPIPQLNCQGKACDLFEPDVVQCTNMGDDGTGETQWKCDTDLPSSLRLGEVQVSCEGWSRPGDTFVVKGSCSLKYSMVQVNPRLEEGASHSYRSNQYDWAALLFSIAFFSMAFAICYSILRSCMQRHAPRYAPRPLSGFWPGGGGGGGGGDSGAGGGSSSGVSPPPYTKHGNAEATATSSSSNFWTGAAVGGATAYLLSGARNQNRNSEWDRFRTGEPLDSATMDASSNNRRRGESSRMAAARFDRDEGGANGLGEMRRATGFGGSAVR